MMSVRILFFGATAEIVGSREKSLEIDNASSTADILRLVKDQHPALGTRKLILTLNEEFASGSETVADGDELAIFTPVSGG